VDTIWHIFKKLSKYFEQCDEKFVKQDITSTEAFNRSCDLECSKLINIEQIIHKTKVALHEMNTSKMLNMCIKGNILSPNQKFKNENFFVSSKTISENIDGSIIEFSKPVNTHFQDIDFMILKFASGWDENYETLVTNYLLKKPYLNDYNYNTKKIIHHNGNVLMSLSFIHAVEDTNMYYDELKEIIHILKLNIKLKKVGNIFTITHIDEAFIRNISAIIKAIGYRDEFIKFLINHDNVRFPNPKFPNEYVSLTMAPHNRIPISRDLCTVFRDPILSLDENINVYMVGIDTSLQLKQFFMDIAAFNIKNKVY
jgi:hypothetical protein